MIFSGFRDYLLSSIAAAVQQDILLSLSAFGSPLKEDKERQIIILYCPHCKNDGIRANG